MILGGAAGVWADLGQFWAMAPRTDPLVIAVNDVGCHYPGRVDAWVTLHPERMAGWKQLRAEIGFEAAQLTVADRAPELVDVVVEHWGGGSSGLYGVAVAVHLGADRVVLCGVPLDESPPIAESLETHDVPLGLVHFRRAWERKRDRIVGCARSMSGWTKDLLGPVTKEWLYEQG